MANRNTQGFPSPEEDPRFHDTYQFLRRYRDATYSLKVVVHQMEHQFKLCTLYVHYTYNTKRILYVQPYV